MRLVIVALLSACGGSEAAPLPPTPRADASVDTAPTDGEIEGARISAACDAQSVVLCRDLETCASFEERQRYANETECRARVATSCRLRATLAGVIDGIALTERCTRAIEAAKCDPVRRGLAFDQHCLGRKPSQHGSLVDDTPCTDHAQCAGGVCQSMSRGAVCGRCATKGIAGSACATSSDCWGDAFPPLICEPTSRRCVDAPLPLTGDPCSGPGVCADGLECRDAVCAHGSLLAGEACPPGKACARGLRCLPGPGFALCKRVDLVGAGVTCHRGGSGADSVIAFCRGATYCGADDVCDPTLAAGAACTSDLAGACGWESTCTGDVPQTCRPLVVACE